MVRILSFLHFVVWAGTACNTVPGIPSDAPHQVPWAFSVAQEEPLDEKQEVTEEEPKEAKKRPFFIDLILYVPNRLFDLFDVVRAGVSVGLGLGVDLTATKYLNATLMTKASVGVGYQTLRHLPIEAASYAMIGVGPVKAAADPGLAWHRSPGDIRVELFLFFLGGHLAVEPFEVFDFAVGIIGFDPMQDDF